MSLCSCTGRHSKIAMRYAHIYLPVLLFLWIGLYLDSLAFADTFAYGQWLTDIIVLPLFYWVYKSASRQIKHLMLFGLLLATAGEIFFSLILGMYTYRIENLPLYVPFGHSLVYASVYYFVKEPLIRKHQKRIVLFLYYFMLLYASLWLFFASDLLGFLSTLLIVYIFYKKPKIRLFFLVMYFMIVYLELMGTHYGCWHWPEEWFGLFSWIPSANPPSGISVFYFGFDVGCLWIYKQFFPTKWKRFKKVRERMRG